MRNNIYFFLIAIFFFSCGVVKTKPSVEQIKALLYEDLPEKKQNEFGSAYYLEHPCIDNMKNKIDTIITKNYDYNNLENAADNVIDLNNKSIDIQKDSISDKQKIKELTYLYNETLNLYYDCEKKKSVTKIITIIDSVKDQREVNLYQSELADQISLNNQIQSTNILLERKNERNRKIIWFIIICFFSLIFLALYLKIKK